MMVFSLPLCIARIKILILLAFCVGTIFVFLKTLFFQCTDVKLKLVRRTLFYSFAAVLLEISGPVQRCM